MDVNAMLAGIALFYWARPIAGKINAWSVVPYRRFPRLKALPGSRYAGTETNFRITFIWFRLCGTFLFVDASYFRDLAISRSWQ